MSEDRGLIASLALHYRRQEIDPIKEVGRRFWQHGTGARVLIVLLAAALGAAMMPLAPSARGWLPALFFVIAWSAACAAAAATRHRAAPILAAAPWLVFYSVLASGASIGTPIAALPIVWLLIVIFHSLPQHRYGAILCWVAVAGAAGYAGAGPSGFRRALGLEPATAQVVVAVLIAAAGLMALRVRRREPLGFAMVLAGSLATMVITIGGSAIRDAPSTIEAVNFVFVDAAATVVLLWLWTAGGFAAGSLKLARLVIEHVGRRLAGRYGRADLFDRMFRIVTLMLLSWFVVEGVTAAAQSLASSDGPSTAIVGLALASVAGGLLLDFAKLGREWAAGSAPRVAAHLGLLTVGVSCAAAVLIADPRQWQVTQSLLALTGMIHLGIPLALHEGHKRWTGSSIELTSGWRLGMFAAGYAGGLIALIIAPASTWPLVAAAPILALLFWRLSRTAQATPLAGALAGAIFASGLIAAWMLPYPPTIPFLRIPALLDAMRNVGTYGRGLLSMQHLFTLFAAWIVCAAAGWTLMRLKAGGEPLASY